MRRIVADNCSWCCNEEPVAKQGNSGWRVEMNPHYPHYGRNKSRSGTRGQLWPIRRRASGANRSSRSQNRLSPSTSFFLFFLHSIKRGYTTFQLWQTYQILNFYIEYFFPITILYQSCIWVSYLVCFSNLMTLYIFIFMLSY